MKRVIKYLNIYERNGIDFSSVSTKYELIPTLVSDDAGATELLEIAKSLNLAIEEQGEVLTNPPRHVCGYSPLQITHAVVVDCKQFERGGDEGPVYLGFITLPSDNTLPAVEGLETEVSEAQADQIVDNQSYGVWDVGPYQGGGRVLVKASHKYDHCLPLLGYSLESFETVLGVTDSGFDDDTYRCGECGIYDDETDGYHLNHREIDGEIFGVNCGCYTDACTESYQVFVNDSDKAIELEVAEFLEEQGKLEFVERFIGGMVDGRGGYFNGESVNEGTPEQVLNLLRKKDKKGKYLFSHDESGQFQTYFSVWKVVA